MKIQIMGHRRLAALLNAVPNTHHVIMISTPNDFFAIEGSENIPKLAKSCLTLAFNDISVMREGYIPPSEEHVQKALDFAKGKDELIIACQAGISRSSGMAYVVKTANSTPMEALEILDPHVHQPNMLVVKAGAKILNKPDMIELALIWNNKAMEMESAHDIQFQQRYEDHKSTDPTVAKPNMGIHPHNLL